MKENIEEKFIFKKKEAELTFSYLINEEIMQFLMENENYTTTIRAELLTMSEELIIPLTSFSHFLEIKNELNDNKKR